MSASPRRVPVRYFLLLREVLQESGISISHVAQEAGLDEAIFRTREGYLADAALDSFMNAARKLTGRDDLGFELGRRIKVNSHDMLGYGLLSCSHVSEFLSMASRHYHLINEDWTMRYRRYVAGGECVYTPCVKASSAALQFTMEVLAVAHYNHIHMLLDGTEPAYDIHMSMPAPAHAHRYAELAPARFHFHENALPSIRVVMGASLLEHPLALGNAAVVREIDEHCSALGKRLQSSSTDWVEYVTGVLRETKGVQPSLKELATRFNVSTRTIDRQLKKEGQSYRELVDKVRFERACEMLCADTSSVAEVAQHLGFSDAANFSRAFKRVVGVYPSEYQRAPSLS